MLPARPSLVSATVAARTFAFHIAASAAALRWRGSGTRHGPGTSRGPVGRGSLRARRLPSRPRRACDDPSASQARVLPVLRFASVRSVGTLSPTESGATGLIRAGAGIRTEREGDGGVAHREERQRPGCQACAWHSLVPARAEDVRGGHDVRRGPRRHPTPPPGAGQQTGDECQVNEGERARGARPQRHDAARRARSEQKGGTDDEGGEPDRPRGALSR